MSCPKCGSERSIPAPDEAPGWAKHWTKCFACGKRWDLQRPAPTQEPEEQDARNHSSCEDLVALVMRAAHDNKPAKEPVMPSTERQCTFITKLQTRCSQSSTKGAVTCKAHLNREPQPSNMLPAKVSRAPITLSEPVIVNPPTNGHVSFAALDAMIQNAQDDLQALTRARAIIVREAEALQ